MQNEIRVLHIDVDKNWRGGQQQALYLHQFLSDRNIFSVMVCKENSVMAKKCDEKKLSKIEVNYKNELDIFTAIKLIKMCNKENINIIVAHSSHALSIALLVKLFVRKSKLVAVRRVDFEIRNNLLSQFKYKTALLNKIVCVSDFIKRLMQTNCSMNEKLITIHSCIDYSKYQNIVVDVELKKELNLNEDSVIIGMTSAFVGHKDYPNFIRASRIVFQKYSQSIFICVGDGILKSEMESLVKKYGMIQNFRFVGFQKNVVSYMKLFDIFILSSKMEGLGSSILEAKAMGLPVIATKAGGIPEIIKDGFDGILVEPQNSESLAQAIIRLIENKNERLLLGKNAMESVKENDLLNYGNKYLELFKQLLVE
jgi:glycosyltransferase involved in cell wall biosynthesis